VVKRAAHPVPEWIGRGRLRWVWALWEPLALYRRSAHMAAYSPGNASWAEEWYLRMHSEEMVARLAGMGVNVVSTHFYKGFGLKAEAEEMDRAARYTELCHKHGIRVLGYHQWATLCYETFLDERPQARDWIQRDAKGELILYGGGTYWRWLGCQQHEAYYDYLREVVRRCLTVAKMDGVEWDGTVYKCHCDLCQARFRDYVVKKYEGQDVERLFGLPHLRHVRIPTTEDRRDPLFQEVMEFRREFMARRLREFNDLIKGINPQAAQVTYDMYAAPAEDPDGIDILVDENHDQSFVRDGVLTAKFRGLKHGYAQSRVVLSTAWLRAPSKRRARPPDGMESTAELAAFGAPVGGLRRPETPAEVKRDLAETVMYGGHLATPTWALRSTGGGQAAFEEPELEEALRLYFDFFRRHEALLDAAESMASVAVLRGRASVTLDYFNSYPCVFGMEQALLQEHVPFDMVFSHQLGRLDRYEALVLAEQTCLSDAEIERIAAFVESGRGLVMTGRTGMYDERFRHRRAHPLEKLLGRERVVYLPDNPERLSTPERDHPPAYHDMRRPERSGELAAAVILAAGGRLPWRVEAGPFVATEGYRVASGKRVIHLLNYANDDGPGRAAVALPADAKSARLVTPDAAPEEKALALRDGCALIPRLDTYAMIIVEAGAGRPRPGGTRS